jgi:hypothetical protein
MTRQFLKCLATHFAFNQTLQPGIKPQNRTAIGGVHQNLCTNSWKKLPEINTWCSRFALSSCDIPLFSAKKQNLSVGTGVA